MRRAWILGLLAVLVLTVAGSAVRVRTPVAAGYFYPAEPDKLLAAVKQYEDEAKTPELPGRYVGCVAPHSAFPLSGSVAGHAFHPLKPGQYDRVIVLASSHFAEFEGCSIPAVQFYRTPLGDVELDGPSIGKLQWCPFIDTRSVTQKNVKRFSDGSVRYPLHETEYSIEMVLPFLQARLGRFRLLPLVVGSYQKLDGSIDNEGIRATVEALREVIDDRTFIVASTDLTHFGNAYSYRPFNDDIPARIEELDTEAIDLVMHRNLSGFRVYIEATDNRICGVSVLELFMRLMPKGTEGVLLDYRTSGQITGNIDASVSYASIAFFNRHLAPNEPKPLKTLPAQAPPKASQTAVKMPPLVPRPAPAKAAPQSAQGEKKTEKKKGLFRWPGRDDKR